MVLFHSGCLHSWYILKLVYRYQNNDDQTLLLGFLRQLVILLNSLHLYINNPSLFWFFYFCFSKHYLFAAFHGDTVVKNPPANAEDIRHAVSIPGWWRSPGVENGRSLWCSCLGNPMDRGVWWPTVWTVAESQTWLSTRTCFCSS